MWPFSMTAACAATLAVLAAAPAQATITGVLDVGSGGTATVTASTITFTPATVITTAATTLTYDGGTALGAGVTGAIKPLAGTLPVTSFMAFPPSLVFNLTAVGPGDTNTNCAGLVAGGGTCSVAAGSPFMLGLTANNSTFASLAVSGTDSDGSSGTWSGLFTAQLAGETPAQIQAAILGGGSISSSFSGTFRAVAAPVPEPTTALLVGAALLGAGAFARRRRSQ